MGRTTAGLMLLLDANEHGSKPSRFKASSRNILKVRVKFKMSPEASEYICP